MQTKQRKTTKAAMKEAVDSFLYRYDWLTGGTREEVVRQLPSGIVALEAMAKTVADLFANAGKLVLADEHLSDYAARMVPLKLSLYRDRIAKAEAGEPYYAPGVKPQLPATAAQLDAALVACGVPVEEILSGADTLPTNVIAGPWLR